MLTNNEITNVRLISYSQPDSLLEVGDTQDLAAYCARVSNPSNQLNTATSEKLIRYLIKHQHWSPLEMVSACLEITTTRDIARQILRHRSFSFQEFSQRYANPVEDLTFVLRDARLQDNKNRQNSLEIDITKDDDRRLAYQWEQIQQNVIDKA
jgi:thymidylate synthase (FAD)